jgi:hypothetical protein
LIARLPARELRIDTLARGAARRVATAEIRGTDTNPYRYPSKN